MSKSPQAICVFTLAAATLCGAKLQAQPLIPAQVTHSTGLVGIAEGQTAQFNALNLGETAAATPAAACTVLLSFVADDGTVLKTRTVMVAPGTGQHIVLDSVADLALAIGVRRDIRATISIPAIPPAAGSATTALQPLCAMAGTLEIYDNSTGVTRVTLASRHKVPPPVITPAN
jgi:hypothetical protein